MSYVTLSAKLDRTDGNTPWGFRLHGGKDFGCPLSIQRVTPGSLASKCGLQVGDCIVKISGTAADGLRHKDAQQRIITSGNSLELSLQRQGGGGGQFSPAAAPPPIQNNYSPSSQNNYSDAPTYGSGALSPSGQNYNTTPKPFSPGGSTVPVAMNKQYNTPINMYSVDNVMDTLSNQTSGMNVSGQPAQAGEGGDSTAPPEMNGSAPCMDLPSSQSATNPTYPTQNTSFNNANNSAASYLYDHVPSPYASQQPIRKISPNASFVSDTQQPIRKISPNASFVSDTSSNTSSNLEDSAVYQMIHGIDNDKPTRPIMSPARDAPKRVEKKESPFEKPNNPHVQSRTFKLLQNMIDSGEDIPSFAMAKGPTGVAGSRKVSAPAMMSSTSSPAANTYVKPAVNNQYNSPAGLYSKENAASYAGHSFNANGSDDDEAPSLPSTLPPAPPALHDSLSAADSSSQELIAQAPVHSAPKVYSSACEAQTRYKPLHHHGPSSSAPGSKPFIPSETYRLVQEEEALKKGLPPPVKQPTHNQPIQSRPIHTVEKTNTDASPKPAAPSPRAPAAAPAPAPAPPAGTWKPQIPTGPRKMKVGKAGEAKSMPDAGGARIPICNSCGVNIRGPFVLALEKSWCPDHFRCANPNCAKPLINCGFVEEEGQIYCEADYAEFFAPRCGKCGKAIVGECVNALKDTFHPHCFLCCHCRQPIGTGAFHMEDGQVYCEKDWQALFQTKCYGCQFPIEPGDRWVEALDQNWHSECFNCTTCQVNLEGQGFFAKSGKPYCKKHASKTRF